MSGLHSSTADKILLIVRCSASVTVRNGTRCYFQTGLQLNSLKLGVPLSTKAIARNVKREHNQVQRCTRLGSLGISAAIVRLGNDAVTVIESDRPSAGTLADCHHERAVPGWHTPRRARLRSQRSSFVETGGSGDHDGRLPPRRPGGSYGCRDEPSPERDHGASWLDTLSLAQLWGFGARNLALLAAKSGKSYPPAGARRGALRRCRYPGRPYRLNTEPQVTDWLAALTILSFLLQLLAGPAYVMAGAKVNAAIQAGEWYRFFTPLFLHGNTLHLIVNLSSLKSLGPQIEATYGHRRYATLYLLSGLSGNLFSFLFNTAPSVGASSAIFGLVGAMAAFYASNGEWFGQDHSQRMLRNIAWVTLLNLGQGLAPASRIDNFGHLGGLLGGAVFGILFGPRLYLDPTGHLVDIPLAQGWLQRFRRRT